MTDVLRAAIDKAVAVAKQFEGCRLRAYWDAAGGVWTIGWGCTGSGIDEKTVWTQDSADAELRWRLLEAHDQALRLSPVLVRESANRQAAIIDFIFNLGAGRYAGSTLRRDIDAGNFDDVAAQLARWDHGGQNDAVLPGLVKRRAVEAALWRAG
ncbi:MAG: lysozyme [Methylococcales bacterium]|nr:lysozyme [Methylococcales bacterium]